MGIRIQGCRDLGFRSRAAACKDQGYRDLELGLRVKEIGMRGFRFRTFGFSALGFVGMRMIS